MKLLTTIVLLACAACAAPQDQHQNRPQAQTQTQATASQEAITEQNWVLQLVGEWRGTFEAVMEPGAEPTRWESLESVRAIGANWIVAEGSPMPGGDPFTSMWTLGYDSDQKAFASNWVDSMQTVMWSHTGHLDEQMRVLTLFAQGPDPVDSNKSLRYKEQVELLSPDQKRITSFAMGAGGEWETYLLVDYHRTK